MNFEKLDIKSAFTRASYIFIPAFLLAFLLAWLEMLPYLGLPYFACVALGGFFSPSLLIVYLGLFGFCLGLLISFRNRKGLGRNILYKIVFHSCDVLFSLFFLMAGAFLALAIVYPYSRDYAFVTGLEVAFYTTIFGLAWFCIAKLVAHLGKSHQDCSSSKNLAITLGGVVVSLISVYWCYMMIISLKTVTCG